MYKSYLFVLLASIALFALTPSVTFDCSQVSFHEQIVRTSNFCPVDQLHTGLGTSHDLVDVLSATILQSVAVFVIAMISLGVVLRYVKNNIPFSYGFRLLHYRIWNVPQHIYASGNASIKLLE